MKCGEGSGASAGGSAANAYSPVGYIYARRCRRGLPPLAADGCGGGTYSMSLNC